MTPGPTRVPERVLLAGRRAMIHHRTPEFSLELAALLELLRPVFGTRNIVFPVHTTGRGAMEAVICNLLSPGDEIAVCCNGKFGELWWKLADTYGIVVHRLFTEWTRDVDADEVEEALRERPAIRAVALAHSDTSTGVCNDVEAIGKVAGARGVLVLVDGVSAIGGMPFAFDDWGVDAALTASQKCLMSSPGVAFVALSDRAWASAAAARLPRNYWDFADIRRSSSKSPPESPGTPPIHPMLQVAEALRMLHEEGLAQVYRRHEEMAARVREGVAQLGLSLQFPLLRQLSTTVTAIAAPPGIPVQGVRDGLRARGILTAGGLGPYEATAFRIGHMGDIRMTDVERTLAALGEVCRDGLRIG